ncbi:MAG: Translation initiation factor [Bacteroidota bacterium]|nr:Translation initiation factor [Bacteroidota bacterium]
MSADTNIKLFKIASEINIGKETIIQFLTSKGFDIENRPTANLTPEMAESVYEKFRKEKKAAEKQREKIQKHKDVRRIPVDLKDKKYVEPHLIEVKLDDNKRDIPSDLKPVAMDKQKGPEIVVLGVPVAVEAKTHEVTPVVAVSEEKAPEDKEFAALPKPVSVFVSEAKAMTVPEVQKTAEPAAEEIKAITSEPEIEIKSVIIEDDFSFEERISKDSSQEFHKPEDIQIEEKNIIIEQKPTVQHEIIKKESQIKPPLVQKTEKSMPPASGESEDKQGKEAVARKKKKRKKLVEIEFEPGEVPKLRGLTIVGKIDLAQPFKDKKEKVKLIVKKKAVPGEEDEDLKLRAAKGKKKIGKGKDKVVAKEAEKVEEKRKKKRKKSIRELISEEDVDKAIRETFAGMEVSSHSSNRNKFRLKRRAEREEKEQKILEEKDRESKILRLSEFVTTADLASMMGVSPNDIILKCLQLGLMVTINLRLDKDTITLIADDYGYEVEFLEEKVIDAIKDDEEESDENLLDRSPIVTIMGHVDHGKTSLLDFIRHSNIVAGEHGGITQHIAAYRVQLPSKKYITFLDTPGHEAFTAMRARGAQVTDIVVLVVAADDSVMPQTIEAISHARAAKVPIVVAINKIDKPDSRPDRIKQQLADHDILVEDWGGTYQSVEISAKAGLNIEHLLEKILLEAELLELKANPDRNAKGTVIEAHMSKGMGIVATVIVQKGTLKVGDAFVAGIYSGRVRAMLDERGNKIESVGPSTPVGVIGFDGLPEAGDVLTSYDFDAEARSIAIARQQLKREQDFRQSRKITLDDISKQIQQGGVKELNLIIKADVAGSVEALNDSLHKLSHDEVRVNVIHKGVGAITENDVMLAVASNAVVIGFQVSSTVKAKKLAENEVVDIRNYNIIYDCINEIHLALEGLLTPEIKEDITSTVEIRKVFRISRMGNIAGCYVLSGKIHRNDKVKLLRDGLEVFNGTLDSLKRNKDDVREVDQGYECGIMLNGYNDVLEGDIIEGYKIIEVKRTLS